MRPTLNTGLLPFAVAVAYFFVKSPLFNQYAIQAVATATLAYFLIKKLSGKKTWHLLPGQNSLQMALVTFSLLLIIGKTGNLASPLYPLTYIHLFFLVMSTNPLSAILTMAAAVLFHFSLTATLDMAVFAHLITLPIVMLFFMFAKQQHEETILEKQQLQKEEEFITAQQATINALKQDLAATQAKLAVKSQELNQAKQLIKIIGQQLQVWQKQFFSCEPTISMEIEKFSVSVNSEDNQDETNG